MNIVKVTVYSEKNSTEIDVPVEITDAYVHLVDPRHNQIERLGIIRGGGQYDGYRVWRTEWLNGHGDWELLLDDEFILEKM